MHLEGHEIETFSLFNTCKFSMYEYKDYIIILKKIKIISPHAQISEMLYTDVCNIATTTDIGVFFLDYELP